MGEVIALLVTVVGAFGIGAVVGARNVQTIENAIAYLKQREQEAQAVLTKIAAHKAN